MIDRTEADVMKNWGGKTEPLVTIRCLAYNHEKFIERALDGFLMQETDFPFEILIHDDASTDKTADIIREYEKRFPNVINAIYQTENQYSKHDGTIGRVMRANTRGKYIALCEGDDFWTQPAKLQAQIGYMEKHPDCTMSFHAVNYVIDDEVIKNDLITDKECDITTDQIIIGGGLYCATLALCFRTEQSMSYPRYRQMANVGDYPLQVMLATMGKVHYFPDIWGEYRVNVSGSWSESQKSKEARIKHWHNSIEWMEEFNRYTEYKYNESVLFRLVRINIHLYRLGEKDAFKRAKALIKQVKDKSKVEAMEKQINRLWIIYNVPGARKVMDLLTDLKGSRDRSQQSENLK